jgi:hypothetical protein
MPRYASKQPPNATAAAKTAPNQDSGRLTATDTAISAAKTTPAKPATSIRSPLAITLVAWSPVMGWGVRCLLTFRFCREVRAAQPQA